MATIIPFSYERKNKTNIRRKELKTKRTLKTLLVIIRTLLIMSFAGGAFWLLTLPNWVIRSSDDIEVEGNKFLSDQEVRTLIPLSYPQPLLTLPTTKLRQNLSGKAPFEEIILKREILPPSITLKVVERKPVAMVFAPIFLPESKKKKITHIGYLDAKGIFVSRQFYQSLPDKEKILPNFKITGIPEQYLPYWEDVYSLITQSEVKIKEINWLNPNNLILKTELGIVYVGAYTSQFPTQLMKLAEIKKLPQKVPPSQIIYIDLTDPSFPAVKPKQLPLTAKN